MGKKTNIGLVTNMMNFSETGALKQAFIIEAIHYYSQLILADESDWGYSLLSKDAWQQCAKECIKSIEERFSE